MLAMSEVNCIKLLRNDKSLSINKISKTMGIDWRTAKKYADDDQIPQEKLKKKRGMMYEESWGEIVSDWLTEDEKIKKKLRRTNKKIFKDLESMGFTGSYRTLSYYISDWHKGKDRIEEERDKNFERLNHPPADAQVDFGIMEAVKDGNYIDVHALILTLPFSNTGFCVPLPSENQECFLYGLKTIFEQMDGVPKRIRIDNLKAAVIRPRGKHEEAIFTNEFLQFANYYGFETQACNPRSGHEKGNVENKVGYIRYNFVTPSPVIEDLEHLSQILEESLVRDRERIHFEKNVPIKELFELESQYLLTLPDKEYPVFKEEIMQANKYGEIVIDNVKVHIPKGYNYGNLQVIKYWNLFKVVSPHGEILYEDSRPYMNKKRKVYWSSILKNWIQKPRSVTYSRYKEYLPGRIYEYLNIDNLTIRKERIKWLLGLIVLYEMKEINEKFYELLDEQIVSVEQPRNHPFDVNWTIYDELQSPANEGSETN